MGKHNTSAFQRVLALMLTVIMVVCMMPMNVIALEADDRATVTVLDGVVAADDGNGNFTVTEATLNWSAATAEHAEGWWVGVGINAPTSATAEELEIATYTVDGGEAQSFAERSGNGTYIQLWVPVTDEFLANGNAQTTTYEFNWNGQGDNNQKVTLTVVPSENIVLNPKAPDPMVPENVTLTVNKTGNGTVKVNGSEVVDTATVQKDAAVPVEVIPAAGYKIASLTVGGVPKTVEGFYAENVTFVDGGSIVVTFEEITYSINVPPVTGGTVAATDAEGNEVTSAPYGEVVTVSVVPNVGYRIKSVKIGTVEKEITNSALFKEEFPIEGNVNVDVAFEEITYSINVLPVVGGRVTVTDAEGNEVTSAHYGDTAKVSATADPGYRIGSIKVGEKEIPNQETITVNGNVNVEVTFIKVYTVTVKYDENGSVTVDGTEIATHGSVTVDEGTDDLILIATPNAEDGYVVSSVKINDDYAELAADNTYKLTKDKDYTVEIAFALATYSINIVQSQNGTVESNLETVEHGGEAKITIKPDKGYTVDTVLVNGVEATMLDMLDDDQYGLTISGVDQDQKIEVTFRAVSAAVDTVDDLISTSDMVRDIVGDSRTVVYKNIDSGTTVLQTDRAGIRITLENGDKLGDRNQQQIVVTESIQVKEIELFYEGEGDTYPCWHRVADLADGKTLNLVIDDELVLTVNFPEPDVTVVNEVTGEKKEYYCSDFKVKVTADETVTGAGIASVEYYIYAGDEPGEATRIYEYQEGMEILDGTQEFSCDVDVSSHNGDDIKILVAVTDRAGNYSTFEEKVNINYINVSVAFGDVPVKVVEKRGYYNNVREATITITDNHFDADGVELTVIAEAVDSDTPYVISNWLSEGNQHTATVTFTEDANYIWSIGYTNAIGADNDDYTIVLNENETPQFFTVDKTAPTGSLSIKDMSMDPWTKLLQFLTFGLYRNDSFVVTATGADTISPVRIQYYKTNSKEAMTVEQLNGVEFVDLGPDTVSRDVSAEIKFESEEVFVVYLKVTDYAGNYTYISSEGMIIDKTDPVVDVLTPEDPVAINTVENDGTYYTSYSYGAAGGEDVRVKLNVSDAGESGVESVTYWVVKDGDTENPTQSGKWEADNLPEYILVNKAANNSKDVVLYVEVTDKAGNVVKEYVNLEIDIDLPEITLKPENPVATQPIQNNRSNDISYIYGAAGGDEVKVKLDVFDQGDAGIECVEYKIVKDGVPGDITTWTKMEDVPEYISVKKADNNSGDVVLYVKATDKVGNIREQSVHLDIDIVAPQIFIKFTGKEQPDGFEQADLIWYAEEREATITIVERAGNLDLDAARDAIKIVVKDINKTDYITDAYTIGEWSTSAGDNPDKHEYSLTVTFTAEGYYDFGIGEVGKLLEGAITDKAGNGNTIHIGDDHWRNFYISLCDPTGAITWGVTADGKKTTTGLPEGAYGIGYFNQPVEIQFTFDQSVKKAYVFAEYGDPAATDLQDEEIWTPITNGSGVTDFLDPNQKATIFMKLVNRAGRVTYISTDTILVDNMKPVITVTPEGPMTNGFYTGDVTVKLVVTDPNTNGPASGFVDDGLEVTITDSNGKEMAVPAFTWQKTEGEGGCVWTAEIVLEKEGHFDNNEFTVKVTAADKAGNTADSVEETLAIDTEAPAVTVAFVDYGNYTGEYFTGTRVATIAVAERNFKQENIEITITNSNGEAPEIVGWTKTDGKDGDSENKTVYTATVLFDADGRYTLEVESCEDDAGNKGNGVVSNAFVIDNTAPAITVLYNNNDAENARYFKEARVATITIKEQNFDEKLVEITQTADQGGVSPNVVWAHNGDTHVATLTYSVDGVYTFDITATDLAGNESGETNYGGSVAANDFVIDTTYEEMVTISGVANGKAYGYGETLIPAVQIEDINLDEYNIKLTGIQKGKTIDLTDQVYALLNAGAQEANGSFDIFRVVQDLDGIYTLSVYGLDKAGNEDREEVTFTVNRFGSVYVYNDYLMGLIANGGAHTTKVTDDLVITEYNAVRLLADSLVIEITCDGRPLENPIYDATPEINDSVAVGESGWYQYRYTISKDNFASDGVYKITVSSKDVAGNIPENNNYEGMSITFRVDTTAPEITSVVGLEEAIVNATELTVKYDVYDTMGIKAIKVYVDDVLVDEITDFSDDLSNYSGSFTLTEKNEPQHVRIMVEDLSGNVTDTDSEYFVSAYEFHNEVTVSTNIFIRWYANKGLFWGSIIGVAAAAGLGIFLIAKKRKKAEAR